MSHYSQLSTCLYRYMIQIRRFKRSVLGLLMIPAISALILYFMRDKLNQEFDRERKGESNGYLGFLVLLLAGTSYIGYVRITIGEVVNERTNEKKSSKN